MGICGGNLYSCSKCDFDVCEGCYVWRTKSGTERVGVHKEDKERAAGRLRLQRQKDEADCNALRTFVCDVHNCPLAESRYVTNIYPAAASRGEQSFRFRCDGGIQYFCLKCKWDICVACFAWESMPEQAREVALAQEGAERQAYEEEKLRFEEQSREMKELGLEKEYGVKVKKMPYLIELSVSPDDRECFTVGVRSRADFEAPVKEEEEEGEEEEEQEQEEQ
ncbi:hypothetical protein B484DRAFT_422574 [Ochromonadaceae sp. CCMP2298]|nr:hypothetical protein B484DRAFT_422574 [Ochromonadaceae sp. CCMP2298]